MQHEKQFYIDGKWVDPVKPAFLDVIDPSTEEAFTQIAVGSAADVDRAVAAARFSGVTLCSANSSSKAVS